MTVARVDRLKMIQHGDNFYTLNKRSLRHLTGKVIRDYNWSKGKLNLQNIR